MKYKANPVTVEAHIIIGVGLVLPNGGMRCALQNGENAIADKAMISRMIPQEGDYWVVQEDGYVYLNPKAIFERKYSPVGILSTPQTLEACTPLPAHPCSTAVAPPDETAWIDEQRLGEGKAPSKIMGFEK